MHIENIREQFNVEKGFTSEQANKMQRKLIIESGLEPKIWVQKNADIFREIIDTNPDLYEIYNQEPKVAEEAIRQRLEEIKSQRQKTTH